jgi:hypothetical protein
MGLNETTCRYATINMSVSYSGTVGTGYSDMQCHVVVLLPTSRTRVTQVATHVGS